jgi:hypothetical protein
MLQGYFGAMLKRTTRQTDADLQRFIRSYQWKALFKGKMNAVTQIEDAQAHLWKP